MVALREYVLSVSATAMLCGILMGILGEKTYFSTAVKVLCGLAMLISVLNPFVKIRFDQYLSLADGMRNEGNLAAEAGVDYAKQAMARRIKEKTASYILNEAKRYQVSVQVEVGVTGDDLPVPDSVTLTGTVSPYARRQLQQYIESKLGIPREKQRWIN